MSSVAVLGAGVSGLASAAWLQRAGHTVTILEAKPWAGGLNQTARDGTIVAEYDDTDTLVTQTAKFDPGQSVGLGPGRIPHHHRRVLALCHTHGIDLDTYIMSSDANLYADAHTGTRWTRRRIEHDARGYMGELAHEAPGIGEHTRAMARAFGDLTHDGFYGGTDRAPGKPLPLDTLARARFWDSQFWQPTAYLWQDSMFAPRSGMDAIVRALVAEVGDRIVLNAPVTSVRTSAHGVRVAGTQCGTPTSNLYDWCLSSVPLPLLADSVELRGFSGDYESAVATPAFAPACKVGWQSRRRFWEDDTHQILGGISYTNHDIGQYWYPSTGFFTDVGTLTGAYNYYARAERFGALSVGERLEHARAGGALLHDEMRDETVVPNSNGITIAWHRVPYQRGGWCHWNPADEQHAAAFTRLHSPDGRFVAIGDQVSDWPGWQEGALQAAERAVGIVTGHSVPASPDVGGTRVVPDSAWLTTGDHPTP